MNISKQLYILAGFASVVLGACGEKKMAEPIPDAWAKASQDCLVNADKTIVTEVGGKCDPRRSAQDSTAKAKSSTQ